jgi:hypothetical protein
MTRNSSSDRRRGPPSLGVSLAFLAVTLGAVGLVYAVAAAPVLAAAFAAGVVTAGAVAVAISVRDVDPSSQTPVDPEPFRR